jgi:carboxyl-terminal processing protease
VQTRGPNGDIEINEDTDSSVIYGGPLIVLTSRFSASASEIVAGALQDYGRALVVGDSSTFGKGTVQAVVGLAPFLERSQLGYGYDPGALKVTVRKFYRPSGASTQLKGVAADIVLPSPSDLSDVSESALKNPLPWDSVPAANYKRLNWVQPYLEVLREKSARRVSANEDFKHLREDTAVLKKNLAAKAVSLNEADRRREREEALARAKEREQEAAKDRNAEVAEYEITVKNAGRSGLPTPMARTNRETAFHSASNAVAESPDIRGTGSSPEDDIVLGEAERILADYAEMLAAGTGAVPRRDRNSK